MLTLRKEIKMGAAIGLTVLGIAGVYGLMASLSGDHGQQATTTGVASPEELEKRNRALNEAVTGLPDDTKIVSTPKPPEPAKPLVTNKSDADPYLESNRQDGNLHNDTVLAALTTGRLGEDSKPKTVKPIVDSPLVTPAPVLESKRNPLLAGPIEVASEDAGKSPVKEAKAKTEASADAATAAGGKYTVAAGDTFSTIAAKVYGNRKYYAVLVKANPDVNPSKLKIGHVINVPTRDAATGTRGALTSDRPTFAAPIDTTRQYRVVVGDTLSRISSKLYGKSTMWEAIYEANKTAIGADSARLKVGTVLELPQKPAR